MNHKKKTIRAEIFQANGYRMPAFPEDGNSFTLPELKHIVGGYIEIQKLPKTGGKIVMNEDGKNIGLKFNAEASKLWRKNYPVGEFPNNNDGLLVGDILVVYDGRMLK